MKPFACLLLGLIGLQSGCSSPFGQGAADAGSAAQVSADSPRPLLALEHPTLQQSEDTTFLRETTDFGRTALRLARMAETNSSDASIQSFARQLADQQSGFNEDLAALASLKGLGNSAQPQSTAEPLLQQLNQQHGPAFDRAWQPQMVHILVCLVRELKLAHARSHDADILVFADATLPETLDALNQTRQLPLKPAPP